MRLPAEDDTRDRGTRPIQFAGDIRRMKDGSVGVPTIDRRIADRNDEQARYRSVSAPRMISVEIDHAGWPV